MNVSQAIFPDKSIIIRRILYDGKYDIRLSDKAYT